MPTSYIIRFAATILVVIALTGCDVLGVVPGVPPGGRAWVVTVTNKSPRPATLVVAEETGMGTAGRMVGTANPSVVAAGATVDVTFGLPAGFGWAIFVNPRPDMGPLLLPSDVSLAIGIEIDVNGNPGWLSGP